MAQGGKNVVTSVIVGSGTIGLAFGAALAASGRTVVFHDRDDARLARLAAAEEGRAEAALHAALVAGLDGGRIRASATLAASDQPCDYILCVPTADAGLDQLRAAVLAIAAIAGPEDVVLIRSTVPPGTTRQMQRLASERAGFSLRFAAMPDRSVEGRSFADQFTVPHLVGALDDITAQRAAALLAGLAPVMPMASPEAAEAAKLFGNLWRAGTFALANAFALVAEDHGLDLHHILSAGTGYPRFSPPRPGLVGGPCLPKDIGLMLDTGRPESVALFDGIRRSEAEVARRVHDRAIRHLSDWQGVPRVAMLGLAFKGAPPVADLRGSPALALAAAIAAACPGCDMVGWDPAPLSQAPSGMALSRNPEEAASGSALTVLGHDHPDVLAIDLAALSTSMAPGGLVMDLTGQLPIPEALAGGVRLWSFGRGLDRACGHG